MESFPDVPFILDKTLRGMKQESSAVSQYRQVQQVQHRPFYRYELSLEVLSPTQLDDVRNLWLTHQGWNGSSSAINFHFEDPNDHTQSKLQFGTGDGSTKKFNLKVGYTSGSTTEKFAQGHIQSDTETIYNGGSTTTAYTLTDKTGVIEFDSAPADGNKLEAEFDFWRLCRFAGNQQTLNIPTASLKSANVTLIEVAG